MKKIFLALIGLVAVGYLASPLVIGLIAREQFPSVIEAANAGSQEWKAGTFNLGYRHSSAESTLTIPFSNHAPVVVHLHHRITQRLGADMSVMEVTTTPTFEGDIKEKAAALFGENTPIVTHTIIYLDGHYTARMDAAAFAPTGVPGVEGLRVGFSGLHGTETGTFKPQKARTQMASPGFEVDSEKDGVHFKVRGLKFSGDLSADGRWMMFGKASGTADEITITPKSLPPTQLSGLGVDADIHHDGDTVGVGYNIHVDKFKSPGLKYKNLAVELAVDHIDENTTKEMTKRFAAIGQRVPDPKQAAAMYGEVFSDVVPALLAHSPAITVKRVAFDLPTGHVKLRANAKFDGNGFTGPVTPAIVSRVLADANVDASKGAFHSILTVFLRPKAITYLKAQKPDITQAQLLAASQKVTEQLAGQTTQNLLDNHLMTETDEGYTSHVSYSHGAITVNGQALGAAPLPGAAHPSPQTGVTPAPTSTGDTQ